MGTKTLDENRHFLTPAEQTVADAIKAAGDDGDPYGDNEDEEDLADVPVTEPEVATEAPAAEPEPEVATEAPDAEPEPEVAAAPLTPVAVDLSDLKNLIIPHVPTVDTAAYEVKIADVEARIAAVDAEFESGSLTPQERAAQLQPLRQELRGVERELSTQTGRALALQDMAVATHEQVLGRIRTAGAASGLDYGKPGDAPTPHAQQFDLMQQALQRDPKHASKTWVEMAALADAQVRLLNGIGAPPAPAAPAAPPVPAKPTLAVVPPRAKPVAPPTTLRDLPAAARPAEQGDTLAGRIAVGNAHQRDAIWNAMTREQRLQALGE
jgi:hypothetical protein